MHDGRSGNHVCLAPSESCRVLFQVPVSDVRIETFAARPSVTAQRVDVEFPVVTRTQVLVGVLPRVFWHAGQIAASFPVLDIRVRWPRDQRFQTLFAGRIAEIIQSIELERTFDVAQILLNTRDLRIVDASIFPKIPGFFIVTSVYMIGEKAADVISAAANR